MNTILLKKKNHKPGDGLFLKTPSKQFAYYNDAEIEQLRSERRIAPNQAEVLEKGKTSRRSSIYVLYSHTPPAYVKNLMKRYGITIPEAARVLGVNTRTMQRWTTPGSGTAIPPHMMDILDAWPNYRDQGGTVEEYREELRKEGHPAFMNKKK